ncbi:MAG: D-aminoacyl-tRNA deacylase [Rhodospirillales bacterium]
MKVLLQRAGPSSVTVDGATIGAIERGLVVLVCAEPGDRSEDAIFMARKVALMRIFPDDDGKMNRSVLDEDGAVLAISQFTLAAEWRKGNRPGFSKAAHPDIAKPLFDRFCAALRDEGLTVETGSFGADMKVSLLNDGPVTIWMDSRNPI